MPDPPPVMKMVLPVSFMARSLRWFRCGSFGEAVAEHRQAAHGLGLRRLVLEHVPMLGELAILDAQDVGCDPGSRPATAGKAPMRDHIIALGDDELVFVSQRVGQGADEVEE